MKKEESGHNDRSDEIIGDYWSIWKEGSRCFLEYDKGHFATEMVTVRITEEEYSLISDSPKKVYGVIDSKRRR